MAYEMAVESRQSVKVYPSAEQLSFCMKQVRVPALYGHEWLRWHWDLFLTFILDIFLNSCLKQSN